MVQIIEELEYGMTQQQNENATESKIMTEIRRVSGGLCLLEDKILMLFSLDMELLEISWSYWRSHISRWKTPFPQGGHHPTPFSAAKPS